MKVILMAGGQGTRLWPVSISKKPKQFCKIIGDKSPFEMTLERFQFLDQKDIYISSITLYQEEIEKITKSYTLLLEPALMDTAPSLCFSTLSIDGEEEDIIAFIPSDHHIKELPLFQKDIKAVLDFFSQQKKKSLPEGLLLLGIKPTSPSNAYGYMKVSEKNNQVLEFKEKPSTKVAQNYLNQGNYLWNSGMFFVRKGFLKKLFQEYAPNIYEKVLQSVKLAKNNPEESKKIYESVQKISFDYAIVEHIQDHIYYLPNHFSWSDLGSWNNLHQLNIQDSEGNYSEGNYSEGNYSEGNYSEGNYSEGNYSKGNYSKGNYSKGNYSKGNYSKGKGEFYECKNTFIHNETNERIILNGIDNVHVIASNGIIYIESKEKGSPLKDIL